MGTESIRKSSILIRNPLPELLQGEAPGLAGRGFPNFPNLQDIRKIKKIRKIIKNQENLRFSYFGRRFLKEIINFNKESSPRAPPERNPSGMSSGARIP